MTIALPLESDDRLSRIETAWTMIFDAHAGTLVDRCAAQTELLRRYGGAIERYLRGAFRDEHAAEETYQEFAIRFLRGDYGTVHPDRGRFRGFLKTVLSRLVADHYRGCTRRRESTLDETRQVTAVESNVADDESFTLAWREELLTKTWQRLAEDEKSTGKPWMTVLRLRVEYPEDGSQELAGRLADQLGESVSAGRLRVTLHRSREKFANHLIDVVASTLDTDSIDSIEDELAEIELLPYCQSMLQRRRSAMAETSPTLVSG